MKHTIATTNSRIRSFLAMLCCILVAIGSITVFDASRTDAASKKTPGTVSIKSLKASGTSKVTVKWKKAKNATSYRIAYKNGRSWITLADVSSKKSKYTHVSSEAAPLIGGKKYTYRVQAYNSKSGKWGKAKTKSITMPAVPSAVTLKNAKVTKNKVTITWQKAKNATAYRVYYKKAGTSKWKQIATASSKASKYVHKNSKKYPLKKGVSYTYMVRGYNKKSKQLGACNNIVQVTIGAANAVTPATPVQPTQPTAPVQPVKPVTPSQPTTPVQPSTPAQPVKPTTPSQPQDIKINDIQVAVEDMVFSFIGQTKQVSVTFFPANATNKKLTWRSSNPNVATVDANGMITARGNGEANIILSPTDGSGAQRSVYVMVLANTDVQKITLSQTSATLTKKGQTLSLTATVSPADASTKELSWNTSDTGVATVSNGVVTAVGNGTATITAAATDGSGVYATCQVTVQRTAEDMAETISIAGGDSDSITISKTLWPNVTDVSKVTFDVQGNNDFVQATIEKDSNWISYAFRGYRQGTFYVAAKYNGSTLRCWKVTVTSTWQEYYDYVAWRKSVEAQIWNNSMTLKEKLDVTKNYIQTEFSYSEKTAIAVYSYKTKKINCKSASELMADFAKDLGCQVKYVSAAGETNTLAETAGGHTFVNILVDGTWIYYDAQPQHT